MNDELELELDNEDITREKDRNKKLADKVKITSEERDAKVKELEETSIAKAKAEKERDFFKGFNQVSAKYPGATEYQDKILEKVNAGYDVEDATVAILNKEGKLTAQQPKIESEKVAGGSAATSLKGEGGKTPQEMTQAERLADLKELEAKGELSL